MSEPTTRTTLLSMDELRAIWRKVQVARQGSAAIRDDDPHAKTLLDAYWVDMTRVLNEVRELRADVVTLLAALRAIRDIPYHLDNRYEVQEFCLCGQTSCISQHHAIAVKVLEKWPESDADGQ